jgi:hypothetical protein
MHDPYVKSDDQNILKYKQQDYLTQNIDIALKDAEIVLMCTAHKEYLDQMDKIISGDRLKGIMDACNIYHRHEFQHGNFLYSGIGRGTNKAEDSFISFVYDSFRAMEKGLANELINLIDFYNGNYAFDEFNKVKFADVQRLAKTCSTGCEIAHPDIVDEIPIYKGFSSELSKIAFEVSQPVGK